MFTFEYSLTALLCRAFGENSYITATGRTPVFALGVGWWGGVGSGDGGDWLNRSSHAALSFISYITYCTWVFLFKWNVSDTNEWHQVTREHRLLFLLETNNDLTLVLMSEAGQSAALPPSRCHCSIYCVLLIPFDSVITLKYCFNQDFVFSQGYWRTLTLISWQLSKISVSSDVFSYQVDSEMYHLKSTE